MHCKCASIFAGHCSNAETMALQQQNMTLDVQRNLSVVADYSDMIDDIGTMVGAVAALSLFTYLIMGSESLPREVGITAAAAS